MQAYPAIASGFQLTRDYDLMANVITFDQLKPLQLFITKYSWDNYGFDASIYMKLNDQQSVQIGSVCIMTTNSDEQVFQVLP